MSDNDSNTKLIQLLIGLEGDIRQFRQKLEAYERTKLCKNRLDKQSDKFLASSHKIESLTGELCTFFPEPKFISTIKVSDADRIEDMVGKLVSLRESLEEAKRIP